MKQRGWKIAYEGTPGFVPQTMRQLRAWRWNRMALFYQFPQEVPEYVPDELIDELLDDAWERSGANGSMFSIDRTWEGDYREPPDDDTPAGMRFVEIKQKEVIP